MHGLLASGITLFPAYAGVIPVAIDAATPAGAFPRIRGGDPGYAK